MHLISLGPETLGRRPHIIGSLTHTISKDMCDRLYASGIRFLEIRADLFPDDFDSVLTFSKWLQEDGRFGLLGTLRETPDNKSHRTSLFSSWMPYIDAIDIEIDTPIRYQLMRLATQNNKKSILSYHHYEKTPSNDELASFVEIYRHTEPDILKIAVHATCRDDSARFMRWIYSQNDVNLIGISMGPHGALTRICAPLFGSMMSYGYVQNSVAPGQLSVFDLSEAFQKYYPDFTRP